jgi:50S ribosomal protein L16 3-hydroxylase
MITRWMTRITRDEFFRHHYHAAPYSEPGSGRGVIPLMTWEKVAALLGARPRPDLIVARAGVFLAGAEPEDIGQAQALFESGCSIVLRHVNQFDPDLAGLAASVENEFEGEVTIHTFATPIGAVGFGWHYDCEDVFIAQTAGTKEYLLRQNTVNPQPTLGAMPKDMEYEKESSPVMACTLAPGDWIYIPRGWWHRGFGQDDSLSISIGVLSPEAAGKVKKSQKPETRSQKKSQKAEGRRQK